MLQVCHLPLAAATAQPATSTRCRNWPCNEINPVLTFMACTASRPRSLVFLGGRGERALGTAALPRFSMGDGKTGLRISTCTSITSVPVCRFAHILTKEDEMRTGSILCGSFQSTSGNQLLLDPLKIEAEIPAKNGEVDEAQNWRYRATRIADAFARPL